MGGVNYPADQGSLDRSGESAANEVPLDERRTGVQQLVRATAGNDVTAYSPRWPPHTLCCATFDRRATHRSRFGVVYESVV